MKLRSVPWKTRKNYFCGHKCLDTLGNKKLIEEKMSMKKRVLAVIPARAGSKGIPNKNIRLLNGKPLIYYVLQNALNSKMITDILVTTDSPEVEVIAKQMGIKCHRRPAELCGDSVALDIVIYNAAKEYDCDYVVTMQPTSPLLKPETLDAGIESCIESKLDALISVINKPHLTWRLENGKPVQNYKERLNRQYLPANYCETGAFFVSKREVVTETSRFGENVGVFEVSESEALDIDSFQDLCCAEMLLMNKAVAFYVNGNNLRGVGHVYRVLELADEFYIKPDIYYDIHQTDPAVFGKTTHQLIPVNGIGELLNIVSKKQYTIFVNDVLTTSIDYMIALRQALPDTKIVNFEDDGEGIIKADLVINALYAQTNLPHVKTGEKFYISSKLFMFYQPIQIAEKVHRVFISFGGADPQNYTDRLLAIISDSKYASYRFCVVLGRAKQNVEELLKYNSKSHISVHYNISNMPEIMSQCDIGLTSRGRTGYELALLGIPSIAIAQNAREEKHGFVCEENGFAYLGLNPGDEEIQLMLDRYLTLSPESRQRYQDKLLKYDLRNGRRRVLSLINNL